MKLTIGRKLLLGFAPVILTMLILGVLVYRELGRLHMLAAAQAQSADRVAQVMTLSLRVKTLQEIPLHYLGTPDDSYRTEFAGARQAGFDLLEKLSAGAANSDEAALWQATRASLDKLVQVGTEAMSDRGGASTGMNGGGNSADVHMAMTALDAAGANLDAETQKLRELTQAVMARNSQELEATLSRVREVLVGAVLVAAILAAGASIWLARHMTLPIRRLVDRARQVAQGDLTVPELPDSTADELGEMARAFNAMVADLRALVSHVTSLAASVRDSASQLDAAFELVSHTAVGVSEEMDRVSQANANQQAAVQEATQVITDFHSAIAQISKGASAQAVSTQQAAEVVDQMVDSVRNIAEKAGLLTVSAEKTASSAHRGSAIVGQTLEAMQGVRTAVLDAAARIHTLHEQSRQIGMITDTISDIVAQTNLLALNAAIEASRAGEHGRGFAVVAGEVRRLAERAGKSAEEISALIRSIQGETTETVQVMEQGSAMVSAGAKLAEQAGQALQEIKDMADKTALDVQAISAAAQRLAASGQEVTSSVTSIAAVARENSTAAQQMAAGSSQVTTAMRTIADLSRENTAVADKVTGTVREMARSARNVEADFHDLTSTAEQLKRQVARFAV